MDLEKEIEALKKRIKLLEEFHELKKRVEELEKYQPQQPIYIPCPYPIYPQPYYPPQYPWTWTTCGTKTNSSDSITYTTNS